MLCFRHTFLRDLDEVVPASHPKDGHAYPFKIKPSELVRRPVSRWSYRFELNPEDYDEVWYGQMHDATPLLREMGAVVATKGVDWANTFTVERALELLENSGSNAWCERLWIDDYRARTNHSID